MLAVRNQALRLGKSSRSAGRCARSMYLVAFMMRYMSVCSLLTDVLSLWAAEGVNGLDLSDDIIKVGTAREMLFQFCEMSFDFSCSVEESRSRSSKLINSKPHLVDSVNEVRIPAVTGHKVGGCSLR